MKKLMFVAALVAGTTVFADCDIPTQGSSFCAEVYDVTMTVKTTVCKCKNVTSKDKVPCGIEKNTACVSWREVATKKVTGMVGSCDCTCTVDNPDDSSLIALPYQLWWIAKDKVLLQDEIEVDHLYRIGKKNEKVEFAANYGALRLAGTGTFKKVVTKVSGNVAGLWLGPIDCADDTYSNICPNYLICDTETTGVDETVAYGSFTLKYNSKASKYLAANDELPVPAKVLDYDVAEYYHE